MVKSAKGKNWKINFVAEFTARKTPQQNLHAKTLVTIIAAQARLMMVAAQIPDAERLKLWPEVAVTCTFLNNLYLQLSEMSHKHVGSMLDTNSQVWQRNFILLAKPG